ncbi:DUF4041 domain-containing protein [Myceligenerans indicum]|uniref:DUF4041 domain-containing protein n=1 Tax=Myceligenerans indicum TaxID=2593663 RepID=UPI0027DCC1A2|nr:DUF4041 domain-containing protein [Myceligenerans indicum]
MPQQSAGNAPLPPGASTPSPASNRSVPIFGARKKARELGSEVDVLRAELQRVGALDAVQIEEERIAAHERFEASERDLEVQRAAARDRFGAEIARLTTDRDALVAKVAELQTRVAQLDEAAMLQEVGVYEYQHPLENAEAYRTRLETLRSRIKEMSKKDGGAVTAVSGWQVNGSAAGGRRLVSQTSKLMLRAYNGEADVLVRGMKPYRLEASIDRLNKSVAAIEKLGRSMQIAITPEYHHLRINELQLTADFLEKRAEEKNREKEELARMREERKVAQQLEREREKLEKERQHYENARAALLAKGDEEGAQRLAEQIGEVAKKIDDVDYRAANHRAGYVYVISNVGAFGDHMVKIGMTRRLDPMDRVRELGDASVPFRFDVHALFFANDAVGIEAEVHRRMAERRVNRVNLRREFFYATPHQVLDHLRDLAGDVLQFDEVPEAIEFRQSQSLASLATREGSGSPG